jgi:hypothetical protein
MAETRHNPGRETGHNTGSEAGNAIGSETGHNTFNVTGYKTGSETEHSQTVKQYTAHTMRLGTPRRQNYKPWDNDNVQNLNSKTGNDLDRTQSRQ